MGHPLRVRWREGQVLRAADLAGEQEYRLAAAVRHRLGHHRPGIVSGLAVRSTEMGGIHVEPGVAVDGAGRELVVPAPRELSTDALEKAAERLGAGELVLSLRPEAGSSDEKGGAAKDSGAADASAANPCAGAGRNPATPCSLELAAAGAPPGRTPSVPLARLSRGDETWQPTVAASAPAVAAALHDPAGRARLELSVDGAVSIATGDGAAPSVERLRTAPRRRAPGVVTQVHGPLRVSGGVRLDGPKPDNERGLRFPRPVATPEEARPWSLYRTDVQARDDAGEPVGPVRRQLRVELAAAGPEDDPASIGLQVGSALSVDARGRLTVSGLAVEGRLAESPIPADPDDPRFRQAVAEAVLLGANSVGGQAADLELDLVIPRIDDGGTLVDGSDLGFIARMVNPGPGLQELRIFAQLSGDDPRPPILLRFSPSLPSSSQETAESDFLDLEPGSHTLIVDALAVGPGLTVVTRRATRSFDVDPLIL